MTAYDHEHEAAVTQVCLDWRADPNSELDRFHAAAWLELEAAENEQRQAG